MHANVGLYKLFFVILKYVLLLLFRCFTYTALHMNFDFSEKIDNKDVGNNLALWRKFRGIKADNMSSEMGMSEPNYLKYERGEHHITIMVLQKAANILKISPVVIMTKEPSVFLDQLMNTTPSSETLLSEGDDSADKNTKEMIFQLIQTNQQIANKVGNLISLFEVKYQS